jgi:hypothetical protein
VIKYCSFKIVSINTCFRMGKALGIILSTERKTVNSHHALIKGTKTQVKSIKPKTANC